MKKLTILLIMLFIVSSQTFAASTKIYDQDGYRIGTCKKNENGYEAYDLDGKPIEQDVLNNKLPAQTAYFYDYYGNIIKFSTEKRPIYSTTWEIPQPPYKIRK